MLWTSVVSWELNRSFTVCIFTGLIFSLYIFQVHSEPPRVRAAYSEPQLRYEESDRYEQEYAPRARYDDDDFRNGRQGFSEDTLERQKPKPSGNVVKWVNLQQ